MPFVSAWIPGESNIPGTGWHRLLRAWQFKVGPGKHLRRRLQVAAACLEPTCRVDRTDRLRKRLDRNGPGFTSCRLGEETIVSIDGPLMDAGVAGGDAGPGDLSLVDRIRRGRRATALVQRYWTKHPLMPSSYWLAELIQTVRRPTYALVGTVLAILALSS